MQPRPHELTRTVTRFPYTTLFRSVEGGDLGAEEGLGQGRAPFLQLRFAEHGDAAEVAAVPDVELEILPQSGDVPAAKVLQHDHEPQRLVAEDQRVLDLRHGRLIVSLGQASGYAADQVVVEVMLDRGHLRLLANAVTDAWPRRRPAETRRAAPRSGPPAPPPSTSPPQRRSRRRPRFPPRPA